MFAVFQPLVFSDIPKIEYFRNSSSGDPLKNARFRSYLLLPYGRIQTDSQHGGLTF